MPFRLSPDVQVEKLRYEQTAVWVAREDLLPGGTKQTACSTLVARLVEKGYDTFIYARPFCGFAQVALAYVCQVLGFGCTLVCERDRECKPTKESSPSDRFPRLSKLAESYGATLVMADDRTQAERIAIDLASRSQNACKIPLGLDCDIFRTAMTMALQLQWDIIIRKLAFIPSMLWLYIGSGTLTRCFSQVVDSRMTRIRCVDVHILFQEDVRLQPIIADPNIEIFSAHEKFHEPSMNMPPVPSNLFYDAKLWQFLKEQANEDHLWWNVAG